MGDFGYIFGYAIFIAFLVGCLLGNIAGYCTRKFEEPKDVRKLVDGWKKHKSRYY